MGPRITALAIIAAVAVSSRLAFAGPVQIKLFDSSRYNDWICGAGGPPTLPGSQASCGSAKFGKCSDCQGMLIQNRSHSPVKLAIQITGPGFGRKCTGAVIGFTQCSSGKNLGWVSGTKDCGASLDPGKSCLLPSVEFCPRQAGPARGAMLVSVSDSSGAHRELRFPLVGSGDYAPELAAADQAIHRHLDELMKIPHVANVKIDNSDNEIVIDVEVTQGHPIDPVRRAVPPEIGGYWTEVTTYIPVGCGL
jgi:hypothetical protein